jgi:hypothetical protein
MFRPGATMFKTPPHRTNNFWAIQTSWHYKIMQTSVLCPVLWTITLSESPCSGRPQKENKLLIRQNGAAWYCWNRCKVVLENFKGLVKQRLTNSDTSIVVYFSLPHLLNPQPPFSRTNGDKNVYGDLYQKNGLLQSLLAAMFGMTTR